MSEIIRCIKRHFPLYIARGVRQAIVRSIEELVILLDQLEYDVRKSKIIRNITGRIEYTPNVNNIERNIAKNNIIAKQEVNIFKNKDVVSERPIMRIYPQNALNYPKIEKNKVEVQ